MSYFPNTAYICRSTARARRTPAKASILRCPTLMQLVRAILLQVFAGDGIHADDPTVPVLAKGETRTGRLWTYVRDDRPFAGPDPPAAVFFYPRSWRRAPSSICSAMPD